MDRIVLGENTVDTLVAITEDDHITGLMYKRWPPPVMTFPYNKAEVRKFWMRNTISPLDIIFCRAGKVIAICEGQPLSLDYIGPDEPTDLVVELPRGLARTLKLAVGQDVYLRSSIKTVAAMYEYNLKQKP